MGEKPVVDVVSEAWAVDDDLAFLVRTPVLWAILTFAANGSGDGVGLKVGYQTRNSHDPGPNSNWISTKNGNIDNPKSYGLFVLDIKSSFPT